VPDLTAELLGGPACRLGEGPVWNADSQELGWVDILGRALHRGPIDADGRLGAVRTTPVSGHLGAAVPVAGPAGGWLLAMAQGYAHLRDDDTITPLAQPEAGSGGANRMNDAKCDPHGRLWSGSMAYDESPGSGTLYRVDLDGSVAAMITGVGVSNGLGWTADGATMFYNDSQPQTLSAYDFDLTKGTISNGRLLVDGATGGFTPDGLTMDDDDRIWCACWDGGVIRTFDAAGQLQGVVRVPVPRTSSCCFAGPDRDLLVITTGQIAGSDDPDAGRLFIARPGVTGPAAVAFSGELPKT